MSASDKGRSSTATDAKESREPEEIRKDIEQTREELGDTVAAVAEKTDVKQQAQAKAEELKGQAGAKAKELSDKAKEVAPENPVPLAFIGVFVAGVVFGRLLSR